METEQRPIVELLRIMREWCEENFERRGCDGLCISAVHMNMCGIISFTERMILKSYIEDNMPRYNNAYGWPRCQLQPRIEWLDAEIERLEKEQQDTAEK